MTQGRLQRAPRKSSDSYGRDEQTFPFPSCRRDGQGSASPIAQKEKPRSGDISTSPYPSVVLMTVTQLSVDGLESQPVPDPVMSGQAWHAAHKVTRVVLGPRTVAGPSAGGTAMVWGRSGQSQSRQSQGPDSGPGEGLYIACEGPPVDRVGCRNPLGPWEGEASALDLLQGPALDLSLDLLGPGKHNARVPVLSAEPLGMSEGYPGI